MICKMPGCREQVPWEARAATFPAVVHAIGQCMALRFTPYGGSLWRSAVTAFTIVVSSGLPAINIAAVTGAEPPPQGCWSALAEAFEGFLLAQHTLQAPSGTSTPPLDDGEAEAAGAAGQLDAEQATKPMHATANGDAASARHLSGDAADLATFDGADLEAAVLDTLTDAVLTGGALVPACGLLVYSR